MDLMFVVPRKVFPLVFHAVDLVRCDYAEEISFTGALKSLAGSDFCRTRVCKKSGSLLPAAFGIECLLAGLLQRLYVPYAELPWYDKSCPPRKPAVDPVIIARFQ